MSKQADEELLETVGLMPGDDLSEGITITVTAETLKKWDSIITHRCLEARIEQVEKSLALIADYKRYFGVNYRWFAKNEFYDDAVEELIDQLNSLQSQLTSLQNKEDE